MCQPDWVPYFKRSNHVDEGHPNAGFVVWREFLDGCAGEGLRPRPPIPPINPPHTALGEEASAG